MQLYLCVCMCVCVRSLKVTDAENQIGDLSSNSCPRCLHLVFPHAFSKGANLTFLNPTKKRY